MIKIKKLETIVLLLLLISVIFLILNFFFFSSISLFSNISFIILLLIFLSLAFLSYYDFKRMEVHNIVSLVLMIFLFFLNIILFFVLGSDKGVNITDSYVYLPYNNLLAALILGAIFQIAVLISKERAIGLGDVRIAIIVGLIVGFPNLWLWLNITIFSSLLYGLYIAYRKKKIKGVKIPFVPFMVIGVITVILISI
jgi:prepilin signal peptidase PulO-like enzyme (type II secretory pathway)